MSEYKAERTVSAVFKEQEQVDSVIRRLLDRKVSRDQFEILDTVINLFA